MLASSPLRIMTEKGHGRRAAIMEAAKDILVEQGFAGLSFREIAKRTGMTVGNVSYYYGSKDSLMVDLAQYIFDRWDQRLRRHIPSSLTDPAAMFLYSVRYMIEENKRAKTRALLLEMWAMSTRSTSVDKMMATFYGRMREWIEDMLSEINPGLDEIARKRRAALITAQIEGLMILIGPNGIDKQGLRGIEDDAVAQIERLALSAADTPLGRS